MRTGSRCAAGSSSGRYASRSAAAAISRIERVDRYGTLGCEGRQPTVAAPDVEHAPAVEADKGGDCSRLDSGFVALLHY